MKNRILWALVVLNVMLAATLVMRLGGGESTAVAQVRRPADYILVPGEVSGGASSAIYMIDTTNGQLGAMAFDDSRNELTTMPPINLARVFENGPAENLAAPPGAVPRGAPAAR